MSRPAALLLSLSAACGGGQQQGDHCLHVRCIGDLVEVQDPTGGSVYQLADPASHAYLPLVTLY